MEVVNPATGERIDEGEEAGREAVAASLVNAVRALEAWRDRPIRERERLLARAGGVYVNELVKSVLRNPVGGVKESGYVGELRESGIKKFVNGKTVWVQAPGDHDVVTVE